MRASRLVLMYTVPPNPSPTRTTLGTALAHQCCQPLQNGHDLTTLMSVRVTRRDWREASLHCKRSDRETYSGRLHRIEASSVHLPGLIKQGPGISSPLCSSAHNCWTQSDHVPARLANRLFRMVLCASGRIFHRIVAPSRVVFWSVVLSFSPWMTKSSCCPSSTGLPQGMKTPNDSSSSLRDHGSALPSPPHHCHRRIVGARSL